MLELIESINLQIQNQLFKPPFPCSFLLPFFCLGLVVNVFDEDGERSLGLVVHD